MDNVIEALESLKVPIESIKPDPRNARQHPTRNLKAIMDSLNAYGQRKPIVVNIETMTIEAGNGMWEAAQALGWEEIAVAFVKDDKAVATAYGIMDNQSALLAEWDLPTLKDLLEELDDGETNMELVGFSAEEIENLMTQFHNPKKGLTGDDDIPEKVETICKIGDLWELGSHRLLCGDATKKEDVERLLDGGKVDMVFTDPPYGVNYDGGVQTKRQRLVGDDNTNLYKPCCQMAFKFSVKEAPFYLWHAGIKGIAAAAAAAAAGYEVRCEIVWNKNLAQYGALSAQYKQKHEPCYYCFKKGATVNWCGDTRQVTVWDLNRESKNEFHPTQKPVALTEIALNNHKAKLVADFFGGSGSTLIACEKLGRRCFMMEIDEQYCDVIIQRWQNFTGQKAVKL